jgi:hypothetical protein
MTENPTDQPIEHVEGQEPLPDPLTDGSASTPTSPAPSEGVAGASAPVNDAPSTDAPPDPDDDDSAPAPAPPGDVPYADEYAVPDVDEQAQLEAKVPDDPTPLTGDGEDEGDD